MHLNVKSKARPRPKEARTEEDNIKEEPTGKEAEEGGDRKSPKKMVVLTKNRWGKLGEEKRKREMAKAPWKKAGRRGATDKAGETEEDLKEVKEEEAAWEACGSNEAPKKKQITVVVDEHKKTCGTNAREEHQEAERKASDKEKHKNNNTDWWLK